MITSGIQNELYVLRFTSVGAYLGEQPDRPEPSVLLPNRYLKPGWQEGKLVDVFVYHDSEDRLVATTETPKAKQGDFAVLEVKQVNRIGAFLDWGLEKDLFLPYGEMNGRPEVGEQQLVHVFRDEQTGRMLASAKIWEHTPEHPENLENGQKVNVMPYAMTEIGFRVLINGQYDGLVYENEILEEPDPLKEVVGYIRRVRSDGKVDVSLQPLGSDSIEPNEKRVMDALQANGGVLSLSDKSHPEAIKDQLGLSKKAFKKAIGGLYRKRSITIGEDGIRVTVQDYVPSGPKHLEKRKRKRI